jgi:pimeloyl-ACP methyl ester carboxylesterase
MPDRVSSLMLLAPTFHGAVDTKEYLSPFEDNLADVYRVLNKDPLLGRYLLDSLTRVPVGYLARLKHNPEKRANTILRLPPHAHTAKLFLPLSTVEYFRKYIDRVSSDEAYDLHKAIPEIRCPILLVTGTHDAAINTQAARDLLAHGGRDVLQVTVLGAGHHIHLLQYSYFRYVLNCFHSRIIPATTARLNVQRLTAEY